MRIDAAGWLHGARIVPSPNCDVRPPGEVDLLVIHHISLPPGRYGGGAVIDLFTNNLDPSAHPYFQQLDGLRVSAHFLIRRDGELLQFVPCTARAWHAGLSCWQGRSRCNDYSIGIELEGDELSDFTSDQYRVLQDLTVTLRHHFPLRGIAGHSDIAPGRKSDPGPKFDWLRYLSGL